uniref:Uncharacterized protein n=1 Tax=Parascaris univalens TaxID=6257 RepID=A0A914ZZU3_PARUN
MSCNRLRHQFDLFNKLIDDTLECSEAALVELKLNKKDLQVKEANAKVKKDVAAKGEIKTARECRTTNSLSLARAEPKDTSLPVEQVPGFTAVCCSFYERFFSWQLLR